MAHHDWLWMFSSARIKLGEVAAPISGCWQSSPQQRQTFTMSYVLAHDDLLYFKIDRRIVTIHKPILTIETASFTSPSKDSILANATFCIWATRTTAYMFGPGWNTGEISQKQVCYLWAILSVPCSMSASTIRRRMLVNMYLHYWP